VDGLHHNQGSTLIFFPGDQFYGTVNVPIDKQKVGSGIFDVPPTTIATLTHKWVRVERSIYRI
jgi:hypothetical protein